MTCPTCREPGPSTAGRRVFADAQCAVCLEEGVNPFVALPCSHALCPGCYEALGGAVSAPFRSRILRDYM